MPAKSTTAGASASVASGVFDPRRPQRAAGRRRRTSPTTRASAPRCPAIQLRAATAGAAVMVTSHLGRPTEGEFKPEDSLAPVAAAPGRTAGPSSAAGAPTGSTAWSVAPGRGGAAGELPLQQGREEERRGAGAQDGRAVRHLRATTPSAPRTAPRPPPTASRSSRRWPAPARCWRPRSTRSTQGAGSAQAPAGGDRRRQQGVAPS
jgi:hypothetical protein